MMIHRALGLLTRLWQRDLGRAGLGAVVLTVFYFVVPIPVIAPGEIWQYVVIVGLLVALVMLVVAHLRRGASRTSSLLLLLHSITVLFSLAFYAMSMHNPDEFVGLETRIDALYFTLTTMTTTGYGDIVAVGQTARSLVIAVFAFDIVFLSMLLAEIGQSLRVGHRGGFIRRPRIRGHDDGPDHAGGSDRPGSGK